MHQGFCGLGKSPPRGGSRRVRSGSERDEAHGPGARVGGGGQSEGGFLERVLDGVGAESGAVGDTHVEQGVH